MKGFFKSKLFLSLATMVMVLLLTGTISLTSRALAASPNVGTYTAADNGQGAWGGGPLNADGTLGGGASYSLGNGSQVGKLVPTTWNFVNGGTAVNLCFNPQVLKGSPVFPSPTCLVVPVSGTPVEIGETIFRVTLHP